MSGKRIVLAATCLLLALSAVLAIALRSQSQEPARASDITPVVSNEWIAGYRKWTRVNPEPEHVPAQNAAACAILFASSPHGDKYITVYVNDIGRHAMMEEKTP